MGFLDELLRGAQETAARAYNQANPFDGGKNWNTPVARPAQRPQQRPQQQRPQPQFSPQVQQRLAQQDMALKQSQAAVLNPMNVLGDISRAAQTAGKGLQSVVTDTVNANANLLMNGAERGAEVIREATGQNQAAFEQQNKMAAEYRRMAAGFAQRAQQERDPARRQAYIDQINSLAMAESDLLGQQAQDINRGLNSTDPRKLLTDSAETALNVVTAGRGATLMKGLQPAATQVTGQALKQLGANTLRVGGEGAGLGAAYGGINTARDADATLQDYARNMGQGAMIGAAAGVGAQAALPVAGAAIRGGANQVRKGVELHNSLTPAQRQGGFIAGPKALGFKDAEAQGKVFDGVDGAKRFEVSDENATISNTKGKTLAEVLNHPALFENYPQLKDVKVKFTDIKNAEGRFDPKTNTLTINPNRDVRKQLGTILHESQHKIQSIESFAGGGSAFGDLTSIKNPRLEAIEKQSAALQKQLTGATPEQRQAIIAQMNKLDSESFGISMQGSFDNYRRLAGEAEARAVQARMNMTEGERYVKGKETIYRGVGGDSGGGNYYTPDKEFARNFTYSGLDSEIKNANVPKNKIYTAEKLPFAGNEMEMNAAIAIAKKGGYKAIRVSEGTGQTPSIFVFDKSLIRDKSTVPRSTFYDSLDVPKDELIVRRDGGVAMSVEPKGKYQKQWKPHELMYLEQSARKAGNIEQANAYKQQRESLNNSLDSEQAMANKYMAEMTTQKQLPTTQDKLLGSKPAQFLYGDKPAVQKAARKLSSFANKTVQGSDEVSAPLKKMVKEEQSSYDTITDSARKQQADDIIKDMDDDTAYTTAVRILEEGNLDTKGQDAITAIQIAKRLDAKGDETNLMKATEIYNQLSERFSAAGQEVQAAAMLAARSPEGLRYKATKDLKNAGVKVTPEMELELRDKINAVRTTQKQAEQATENARQLTKEFQGPRTPDQKAKLEQARSAAREAENKLAQARDNVQYFVAKRIPSETADKVINFWRSGLLTAPTTTAGALAGNIAGTLTRKLWINPAATMTDWALSLKTGKRAHLPAKAGAWGGGMARGGRNIASKQYWQTGFDPMNPMATADSMGATSRVINYGDSKAGKITTGYVNGVYKVMGGADQPFRYGAYDEVMSSLAKVEAKNRGLTGWQKDNFIDDFIADPPKGAVEVAIKEAGDSTFQNKTALAAVVQSAVSGLKQRGHHKTAALVQSFAPFTGVPSSVADRVIRHTGIKAAKDIVKAIQAARKGEAWDQRELSRYIAEGTIGLPVVAAGFALAQADMFSGAYPTDPQERQKWTDQGRQENSVKINGEWHSLNYIQPFGVLLSIGAGIQQTKGKDGQDAAISDYLTNGAMGAMKSFMGQSYLEGLQGPIEAFSAPEQNLGGYISNTASSAVPNFIRSFARATDDVQRDTKGFVDGLAGSFPGTRQTLPEKLNSAGEPLPAKNNFFNQYVNPLKPSRVMDGNPVTQELTRLFDSGNGVTSSGMKTLKIDGTTHKLDKDQQREYNELLGKATYEKWAEIQKQDNYKSASDEDKASMLSNARTKINNELKEQYIKGETIDLSKSKGATIKPSSGSKSGKSTEVAPTLAKNHKDTIKEFDALSTEERDKKFYNENDAEFRYEAALYENKKANGTLTKAEQIKAESKLETLQIGSKFSKEARELYSLNKTQLTSLIDKGELTNKQAEEILALNDAMAAAGKTNKFRDKYGNVAIRPKAKGSGGGRKKGTGKGGRGGKSTLPTSTVTASLVSFSKSANNAAKNAKVAKKQLPTGTIRRPGIKAYKKTAKTNVSMTRKA